MITTKTSIPYVPNYPNIVYRKGKSSVGVFKKRLNPNYPLFVYISPTQDSVYGKTHSEANVEVTVDESFWVNINKDGLRLFGKAEAGSAITVEVIE